MKNKSLKLVRIFAGVFMLGCLSVYLQAADVVAPNWNINDIGNQIRSLTGNYTGTAAVIGGASLIGNATGNTLNIDGLVVNVADDRQGAFEAGTNLVSGGAVLFHTANQNKISILNGSVIQGRDVAGGASVLYDISNRLETSEVNNNIVSIKDSSILEDYFIIYVDDPTDPTLPQVPVYVFFGGDVMGGASSYGKSVVHNNSVVIDNSIVEGNVFGAFMDKTLVSSDYDENGSIKAGLVDLKSNNNSIKILNNSNILGVVYGSYGASSTEGNSILVDASNVNEIYGAIAGVNLYDASSAATSNFNDNTVTIQNGSNVNDVKVVYTTSVNASGNKLIVDNSTINTGSLRTVDVRLNLIGTESPTPISATISDNAISLNNIPATSLYEIGAGLNLAGTANKNTTTLYNLANLTITRPSDSFGVLDITTLGGSGEAGTDTEKLLSLKDINDDIVSEDNFNVNYGFIYGGAALDYTSQVNDAKPSEGVLPPEASVVPTTQIIARGGKEANGNSVTISNSKINANIIGGFSGELQEINYSLWEATSNPNLFTKTETKKVGNEVIVTTYTCDQNGENCSGGTEESRTAVSDLDDKFTANDNTIILENVDFDGTIYGGFVAGAELKIDNVETSNNSVIIRGNTTLSSDSVIYGGNAYIGRGSNKLIFDHVAGAGGSYMTYNNPNQFQNFYSVWQVNADLDTRLDFAMNNVIAIVNVDNTERREGTATIIKTQTTSDLSDVEQNGVLTDLVDTSVELAQQKQGIYSYSLVGQKGGANIVDWVLSVSRDHQNVEVYGQVPLVGLALAAQGPEMLTKALSEAWNSDFESSSFIDGGYHHTRYHTGSGFDLNSGIIQAGFWKKFKNDLLGGLFVKYSFGNYETYPIKASGNANAFGGGAMASWHYSQTGRIEANLEIGYLDLDFKSSQLTSSLKTRGIYYGALFGMVQDLATNWDMYANLQYLRKDKDSMKDNLGQSINYEAMQSVVLRIGTDVSFPEFAFNKIVPSLGAVALYELDGTSKLDISGTSNDEASMKGFSARGEIGLSYTSEEGPFPLTSKLTLFGQGGKRSGFGGEVNLSFRF